MASKTNDRRIVAKDLQQFSKIYLVPIADAHIGCRDVDMDTLNGYIQWIKAHDNAFTILNGDLMNCAWKDSTPELYEDLCTPDQAFEQCIEIFRPIKDKILMITQGGHEGAIFRKVGHDYTAYLAKELGCLIDYRPNGGMLCVRLSRNGHRHVVTTYATHGWGGARTIGAKVKKARDLQDVATADIFILSHDHTQNINRGNIQERPRAQMSFRHPVYFIPRRKLFINTGGFVQYGGYVQRKGYSPQDQGTPRIRIEIKKQHEGYHVDLHASI